MTTLSGWCAVVATRPGSENVVRLLAALSEHGRDSRALHPADLCAALTAPSATDRAPPSLAVCRLASGTPTPLLDALVAVEERGVPFLNRPAAVRRAHDKQAALAALEAAGLSVPPTVCVTRDEPPDFDALEALPGDRLVVKPLHGASGRGVLAGVDRATAAAGAVAFADLCGPVLVQPCIGEGIDRRLFVVAGDVVAAMERRPAPGDGRGNLVYGATARPIDPDHHERTLARHAASVLGLDIAGVDLLDGPTGPVVLEVNACPGLKGIEAVTGRDVAGAVAEAVERRIATV